MSEVKARKDILLDAIARQKAIHEASLRIKAELEAEAASQRPAPTPQLR